MILYSYKVSACQFMTQDVLTDLLGIEREGTEKKQTNKQKKKKFMKASININSQRLKILYSLWFDNC